MRIEFLWTSDEEYLKIKKELSDGRFKFARIKRNNQNYAMGGFNINPKDYDKGFTPKQIDALSIYLGCFGYDTECLSLMSQEVYTNENSFNCPDELLNTKKNYLVFKNGISFLYKIKDYDKVKNTIKLKEFKK